jgi:predicted nucleic acid-binding protein
VTTAELGYVETRAALAAAHRADRLSRRRLAVARAELERLWAEVVVLAVDTALVRRAAEVAEELALRAGDAIHLAAALSVEHGETLLATWDASLGDAARRAGLAVTP